jgi:hypothetical protein
MFLLSFATAFGVTHRSTLKCLSTLSVTNPGNNKITIRLLWALPTLTAKNPCSLGKVLLHELD